MGKKHKNHENEDLNQMDALEALNRFLDTGDGSELFSGSEKPNKSKRSNDFMDLIEAAANEAISRKALASKDPDREVDETETIDRYEESRQLNDYDPDETGPSLWSNEKLGGVEISRITSMGTDLLIFTDGIRTATIDLGLVIGDGNITVDDDAISAYGLAFLGCMMPTFRPQMMQSEAVLEHTKCDKTGSAYAHYNDDNYRFYQNGPYILGYHIDDESINTFIDVCVDANEHGSLVDLFIETSKVLTSKAFNYALVDVNRVGMASRVHEMTDISDQFIKNFVDDLIIPENVSKSSEAISLYKVMVSETPILLTSYYNELDSIIEMMGGVPSDEDDCDDEFDEDDEDEFDEDESEDVNENTDNACDDQAIKDHMARVAEYMRNQSDDSSNEDESDELLSDVDGAEDVDISVNEVEDGVEAHVSVVKTSTETQSSTESIAIDDAGEFIVHRRSR